MLFSDSAIAILREASWDRNARRDLELMSGGFMWSDEKLDEALQKCDDEDVGPFRCVLAYRASLIRGEPRDELREPWDQLLSQCPDWPGFRPERTNCSLEGELESESDASLQQLEHMSEVVERAQRIKAIRDNRNQE